LSHIWRLYKTGFGLTTVFNGLQYSYSVHPLQLTTAVHNIRLTTAPQPVFHCSRQSHITTDNQSVSASWFRTPSGANDQMLITVWQSKSKSHYDRRPVGQCILVSSPIWGSWPDINYCLTVTVLSISSAPSDERSGLSFVLVTWTASVQCSKFAAGPRQHFISPYL
jgi:hypothetical protein